MTDCPMCGAPQGQRCLTKSGKRRGRPHTARTTTQESTMTSEVVITDDMRSPDERVKVLPFRHPWIKGTDTDPECGRAWHDHGWIDRGDHGFTVCPTEAERPEVTADMVRSGLAAAWQQGYRLDWTGGVKHTNPYATEPPQWG